LSHDLHGRLKKFVVDRAEELQKAAMPMHQYFSYDDPEWRANWNEKLSHISVTNLIPYKEVPCIKELLKIAWEKFDDVPMKTSREGAVSELAKKLLEGKVPSAVHLLKYEGGTIAEFPIHADTEAVRFSVVITLTKSGAGLKLVEDKGRRDVLTPVNTDIRTTLTYLDPTQLHCVGKVGEETRYSIVVTY